MSILDHLEENEPENTVAPSSGIFTNQEIENSLKPLEKSHAEEVKNQLCTMLEGIESIEKEASSIVVKDKDDSKNIKKALELRKKVTKIRTSIEKERKALKEKFLRPGQAIDGISKILTAVVAPIEHELKEKELTKQKWFDKRETYRRKEFVAAGVDIAEANLRNWTDEEFESALEEGKAQVKAEVEKQKLFHERCHIMQELGLVPHDYNVADLSEERFEEICNSAREKANKREELVKKRIKELEDKHLPIEEGVDFDMLDEAWESYVNMLENEIESQKVEVSEEISQEDSKEALKSCIEALDKDEEQPSIEALELRIIEWGKARELYTESDPEAQYAKLNSEAAELGESIMKNESPIDDIGDVFVVLCHLAHFHGLTMRECIQHSYNDIEHRKGKFVGRLYVKEKDL